MFSWKVYANSKRKDTKAFCNMTDSHFLFAFLDDCFYHVYVLLRED